MIAKRHQLEVASAVVAWLPLAVLTFAYGGGSFTSPDMRSFIAIVGIHTRNLISIPLLIAAEGLCAPRLWRLADHFLEANLVVDRVGAERAIAAGRAAFDSRVSRAALAGLAYLATAGILFSFPPGTLPPWHLAHGAMRMPSPAGWWNVVVSLPALLFLVFEWLWRVVVWGWVLRAIVRSKLRLIASHPDRTAGLGFVGGSVRAFGWVGLAISTIVAARSAEALAGGARITMSQFPFEIGFLVCVAGLFVVPLFVFAPTLIRAGRAGGMAYGSLAQRLGESFERRWILGGVSIGAEDPLRVQDFSAMIDLYSVVAQARNLRFVPVSRRDLGALVLALLIPFGPVLLATVPLHVLWAHLRSLVL